METKDLKSFIAVANVENINIAAQNIHVAKGTISKSIKKLENELNITLFERLGRGLKITKEGLFLAKKAREILALEENTKANFLGKEVIFKASIAFDTISISTVSQELIKKTHKLYPKSAIDISFEPDKLESKILSGEVHIGFSRSCPSSSLFKVKKIVSSEFKTVASKKHPLVKNRKNNKISVKEVLEYDFVSAGSSLTDLEFSEYSHDGWRDDIHPRKLSFQVSDLSLLYSLVNSSIALAYLPDYLIKDKGYEVLNIVDCDFNCSSTIYMFTKKKSLYGWVNQVF